MQHQRKRGKDDARRRDHRTQNGEVPLNDEQQLLGAPYEIEWRGKTLRFGGIVEGVKTKCVAAAKTVFWRGSQY
jgi:hypothetical protein